MERKRQAEAKALWIALTLTLLGVVATGALATDVRPADGVGRAASDLTRAYVPCTAPNTVLADGQPACVPAITSPCGFTGEATVTVDGFDDRTPLVRAEFQAPYTPLAPPQCQIHDLNDLKNFFAQVGARGSIDFTAIDTAPCPSGFCTHADVVTTFDMFDRASHIRIASDILLRGNFELLGFRITDPDGLPIAAAGVGAGTSPYESGNPSAEHALSNLTLPIAPCTTGSYCDRAPIASPCDFDSGEVTWSRDASTAPKAHVTLRDVVGTSPLCTLGTYELETTVRVTVKACGTPSARQLCTLPDQAVTVPLQMRGRTLDDEVVVRPGGFDTFYQSTEILGVRVLDPTGAPVAAAGVGGFARALAPRVTLKGDSLMVRATIPVVAEPPTRIDPTSDPGLTVTLSDRNGLIYRVNIPRERWQLQSPIGSRWDYLDPGGVVNGVRKARVKRIVKRDVMLGYGVELKATGVDLSAADFPAVTLRIDVPRFTAGIADVLGVEAFRTCRGSVGKMHCK